MSKIDKPLSSQSWQASVRVVEEFLKTDRKLDALFARYTKDVDGKVSRRVQYLTYGVVRNLGRLQWCLNSTVRNAPKKRLQAILLVAMFEWSEAGEENQPQVVHHAVEQAKRLLSKPETRFVNAVLRKYPTLETGKIEFEDSLESMSSFYSHPLWLVERWIDQFGLQATRSFLEWNQGTPKVYAWSPENESELPEGWKSTDWQEFYEIQQADWETTRTLLSQGKAYIQDPSTRIGPGLLSGIDAKSVLDLCAAPGGKSIQLQRQLKVTGGLLVSVDVPGKRFNRLKENLSRYRASGVEQLQVPKDVRDLDGKDLPHRNFDAVFVDVPCSNTGVLQRRPDVKWRQNLESLASLVDLQTALLVKAADFVSVDGSLIYSTCSVEKDENQAVIDNFLNKNDGSFSIAITESSFPWESGHDGAFACLMKRTK
jgi:16S rRNA (cytosine967-C5)-methyltransferase